MSPRLDPAVAAGRHAVAETLGDLDAGARIVLGVSGGADSLALAAVTAFVAPRRGWQARAIVVDHDLQDGSAQIAARAAEQVGSLGLPAEVVRVAVRAGPGPEAAARRARYAALESGDEKAVLLAHTRDDQAETVLLGLGRGSGPRSIAAMARVDGRRRRPFLTLRRADTERICAVHGLDWWTDPHNGDPAFRRSRLRREVLPLLEEVLGGGVAAALARTADQLRLDNDYLDDQAARLAASAPDCGALADLHPALRRRVLRLLALHAGAAEITSEHVDRLDDLVMRWHGQRGVDLPGRVTARRIGDSLRFAPRRMAG